VSGASATSKAAVDPALTPEALCTRARDYLGERDPATPLASPIFAALLDDADRALNAAAAFIKRDWADWDQDATKPPIEFRSRASFAAQLWISACPSGSAPPPVACEAELKNR